MSKPLFMRLADNVWDLLHLESKAKKLSKAEYLTKLILKSSKKKNEKLLNN